MATLLLVVLAIGCGNAIPTEPSGIKINSYDGGYTGIVFKIESEVPEEHCAEILNNLQVSNVNYLLPPFGNK